jgi:hypothetical protein
MSSLVDTSRHSTHLQPACPHPNGANGLKLLIASDLPARAPGGRDLRPGSLPARNATAPAFAAPGGRESPPGQTDDKLVPALDRLIRIRAVQELASSHALDFIVDLRQVFVGVADPPLSVDELLELAQRIDRLALVAFDVYCRCREQISSIRINEIRNRSLNRIERLNEWRERRDRGDDRCHDQEPTVT